METDRHFGIAREQRVSSWRERFVSYSENPSSDVSRMVAQGRAAGFVDGDLGEQRQFAADLGALLDAVYDQETGGEGCIDDLAPEELEKRTGIAPNRQGGLVEIMVDNGMLKSRMAIEARRRMANSR